MSLDEVSAKTAKASDSQAMARQQIAVLKALRAKVEKLEQEKDEPIAIVGMGCRFPGGAHDPQSFWELLKEGRHGIVPIPKDRWDAEGFYDPEPGQAGKTYVRTGGYLQIDVDRFDAPFFHISPREAQYLDPQQRVLLEVTWEALEHAGCDPKRLAGSKTGVFMGVMNFDYSKMLSVPSRAEEQNLYVASGSGHSVIAGRLSFVLGLQGPSVALDTACSSSLVTVHLAAQSLRSGECDLALAGGVNLILSPYGTLCFSQAKALSLSGFSKTFDAGADGYAQSEGCGVLVLKRLSDAMKQNDRILAVIRGTAVNQDGASSGLTVPNGPAQEQVIRAALDKAKLSPADVDYLEAHGTGTKLGDPIEVQAAGNVLREGRPADRPLLLGSVKTNIGHTEVAAGVAGIIKVVLSLQNEEIPPHLHFETLNPHISIEQIPAKIVTKATPWPRGERPRVAGVSAFGFSGTNAHVIVSEAPKQSERPASVERGAHVLALSAAGEDALRDLAGRHAARLASGETDLGDYCHTANAGRHHFDRRAAVVGSSREELVGKLDELAGQERVGEESSAIEPKKIAFLFTGQGAQYFGMGRRLYETQPPFRKTMDRCAEILSRHMDVDLFDVMWGGANPALIDQTRYTQPALFALEYSLAELWQSWGVRPAAALGHSVGEYCAATLSGAVGLEDGLALIAQRGRLMQELCAPGDMCAVEADAERVQEAIDNWSDCVSIAAVNGPRATVISGEARAIAAVATALEEQGFRVKRLTVSHAFHSALMDPMLAEFEKVAADLTFHAPKIRLVSTVTGQSVAGRELARPDYWSRQVRGAVRFSDGMRELEKAGCRYFLEVGPHPVLTGMGRMCVSDPDAMIWSGSLRRDVDDSRELSEAVARLYVAGVDIDWRAFDQVFARRKLSLPTYPFQRKRYWMAEEKKTRSGAGSFHPLVTMAVESAVSPGTTFVSAEVGTESPAYFADHRVYGRALVPAAAFLEIALASGRNALGEGDLVVSDILFERACMLEDGATHSLQCVLTREEDGDACSFQLLGKSDGWLRHASGRMEVAEESLAMRETRDLEAIRARCGEHLTGDECYERFEGTGIDYGPAFQGMDQLWRGSGEAIARLTLPDVARASSQPGYLLHPVLLDSCFQLLAHAIPEKGGETVAYLPVAIESLRVGKLRVDDELFGHVVLRSSADESAYTGDAYILDGDGHVVSEIIGLRVMRAEKERLAPTSAASIEDLFYEARWIASPLAESPCEASSHVWLFAEEGAFADDLATRLGNHGHAVRRLALADGEEVLRAALQETLDATGAPDKVVFALRSDSRIEDLTAEEIIDAQRVSYASVLSAVRLLVKQDGARAFYLATEGVAAGEGVLSAPLWGMFTTLRLEQPEMRWSSVDFERRIDAAALVAEIEATSSREDQIAYSVEADGLKRSVARLVRRSSETRIPSEPYTLDFAERGSIDNLHLSPKTRCAPGAGEVEIELKATGLNFRDVLNVLGMYPGEAGPLGQDAAGVVTAVGEGVSGIAIGDSVLTILAGSFSSHIVTIPEVVMKMPEGMSFEQAATIPVVFLTTHYALNRLGAMKKGERVLIHAGAGGVGMAAIQLAKNVGAEIFVTVGSPEKAELMRAMGVRHIFSSRNLDFHEGVLQATHGEGVDLVLNSLAGEFIPKSLALLRVGGRFLEIGKTGIWSQDEAKAFRPGASYFTIALDELTSQPQLVGSLFREVMQEFANGRLSPLPLRLYPLDDVKSAFQFMARGKHTGKIVVTHERMSREGGACCADASYLITGGLGGLGLEVARRLVEKEGARELLLVGRKAPSAAAGEMLRELEAKGARIIVKSVDVSDARAIDDLLAAMKRDGCGPLRGVIHAAGLRDDGVIEQQSWEKYLKVMAPKALGAWNLHRSTQRAGCTLDFFVCFSSAASLLGNGGQANYAAANAFLDTLMVHRRNMGLAGLSINWGAWSEVGLAAELVRTQSLKGGMGAMSPAEGVEAFGRLLGRRNGQIGVLPMDWSAVASGSDEPPFLIELLAPRGKARKRSASAGAKLFAELAAAPAGEWKETLTAFVQSELAIVLGAQSGQALDPKKGFKDLGVDSLMSVEIRNRLRKALGDRVKLPATLVFDYPSVDALAGFLAEALADAPECKGKSGAGVSPSVTAPAKPAAPEPRRHGGVEPIAIIGMGCRFPGGASDPEKFWRLLAEGRDAVIEAPKDRWDAEAIFDEDPDAIGKTYAKWGGFLEERIDLFDAGFFDIPAHEAKFMDPQQRLLLEVTWEALENAGLPAAELVGTDTGVFVGVSNMDYARLQDDPRMIQEAGLYSGTGTGLSYASGRVSYLLGLQGPSVTIDTACSSSLVALHQACQTLRLGEASLAIAAGVNLMISPQSTIALSHARALAPDGRSKAFDASANGFSRGEGCGVVILKRLADAVADGDRILAVVRGSAVNQDGASSGLTVPNGKAQEALIRKALRQAEVAPCEVSYVEAHGTGTALGDPIEVRAIGAVLGEGRARNRLLHIGSVKTNLGHLEPAAGMAGLLKVVLALQHRAIPPHLHFKTLNPYISLDEIPARIPTELTDWTSDGPRIAGVSAFALQGTNAHVIVEEYFDDHIAGAESSHPAACELLAISAQSEAALRGLAADYMAFLAERPDVSLRELCRTANRGRSHFGHRLAAVGADAGEMIAALEAQTRAASLGGEVAKIAFLFTGQGSQYFGMGRQAYETLPAFRAALDRCAEIASPLLGCSLLDLLWAGEDADRLHRTEFTQPCLFALEYSLAQAWSALGVRPSAALGHSVGEYVAATIAGVMSLEDALALVVARGRLMQSLCETGAMASIAAAPSALEQWLAEFEGRISIAAINGPQNTVLSGDHAAIAAIVEAAKARGLRVRPLAVSHAFHSPLVEPMLEEFANAARKIAYRAPEIRLVSNLTGRFIIHEEMDWASYWMKQTRSAVLFAEGMAELETYGCGAFVEIGPHPVLIAMGQECIGRAEEKLWLGSLRRGGEDRREWLGAVGGLYRRGAKINWSGLDDQSPFRRLALPTYPFQRKRYWVDASPAASDVETAAPVVGAPELDEGVLWERLKSAPIETRKTILVEHISALLEEILGASSGIAFDLDTNFMDLGVDSLVAVAFKNRIQKSFGRHLKIPAMMVFDHPTIDGVADFLLTRLRFA